MKNYSSATQELECDSDAGPMRAQPALARPNRAKSPGPDPIARPESQAT